MHLTKRRGRTRLLCRLGSQLRVFGTAGVGSECVVEEVAQIFLPHRRRPGQTAPLAGRRLPDRIAAPLGQ